ncbi:MAG TPA: alpha/beta hydrolase [Candidatus Aquabacterium excrementipullorum]|nr:alpha/beta hydrolase [Candidatus Aquabacterium excrementipullorum]
MKWFKRLWWSTVLMLIGVALAVWATWEPDRQLGELVARWAPPPSMFVELDGMQVHVRDTGPRDDPLPIVLLHGMASSLHTWEGWRLALEKNHRVISVDLPGFGLTGPSPQGDYRIEGYTRFVLRLLDNLGVKRVVLAGNALGGEIAWQTALLAPDRVRKLILVDSDGYQLSPLSQPIAFHIAGARSLRWVSERILPRSVIESSVRAVFGHPEKVTQDRVDRYFELALRVGNRRALFQRMDQSESGAKEHQIRLVKQPVLVLWGAKDGMVPVDFADRFCGDIAVCRKVVFPELGHIPQEEAPVQTLVPVVDFLSTP